MTLTIPPFVCGILVTVGVELVALIVAAVISVKKKKNKQRFTSICRK